MNSVDLYRVDTARFLRELDGHTMEVTAVTWSRSGAALASTSRDGTLRIWPFDDGGEPTGAGARLLVGHGAAVTSVAWSPSGERLASGSDDTTVRLWDHDSGRQLRVLEGHMDAVARVAFSSDGRLLASASVDGTLLLWGGDEFRPLLSLGSPRGGEPRTPLFAFHPSEPVLAILDGRHTAVHVYRVDVDGVIQRFAADTGIRAYESAKVVLVGNTNVGKSCLAGRLVTGRYEEQGTTHGMRFWTMGKDRLFPRRRGSRGSIGR